jgi:energy-coupling factor transporter ATP-binding protein EcfA2
MGKLVFIVGKSGMGKSTSLRSLNPDETFIMNTDQKPLPFKKFESKYSEEKGNYKKSSSIDEVISTLKDVHKNKPHVKTFIIDTWSRIMTDHIMSKAFRTGKGFEKWGKFSGAMYDLMNIINDKVRDDLNVYLFAHPETHYDEAGFPMERVAVQGKQLEKFVPESFSSIVLYCEVKTAPGQPNEHVFRTRTSGNDTCKTPLEMFVDEDENPLETIPNDLVLVDEAINAYY